MLKELRVNNFSLLCDTRVVFGSGLNVLTGESGAGKTLIIDAISFVLGKRPNRTLIGRKGDECRVTATFKPAPAASSNFEMPEELVVERSFSCSGRSSLALNGEPCKVSDLRAVLEPLVDITSQFSQQEIFRPAFHRELLDAFGGMEFQCARDAYCEGFHRLRALEAELASRREALQRGAEERNYLRFLVEELAGAGVSAGEKARISAELHLLENAEEVVRQVGTAAHLLYEGDERAPSAFDVIARTNKELGELAGDSRPQGTLAKVVEALTRAMESVAEAKDLLAELGEMPDYSPADIERLRRRLDEINRLEHKHRTPADELPRLLESSQATLDTLETTPGEVEALESRVAELSSKLVAGARRLNEGRRLIARHLEGAASRHLSKLGFASAEFIVEVFEPEDPSPEDLREHGLGHVEFIISLNPDEPARPLAEVASGGEASRLLLAVKGALQSQLSYGTIVFDEIEAGIGGDAAFNVAGVLRDLASKHQVIVVTHLAAVAAAARHHFDVVKSVRKGRTDITVEELTGERRVKTLARMLGDAEQAASRALAEEFLRRMS